MGAQSITLCGNLVADPEMRYTPSGTPVTVFTVAVNQRYRGEDGQWQDGEPLFQRCVVWRELAEHVAESLHKGAAVMVLGRLTSRSYEDSAGVKRYVTECNATEVGASLRYATVRVNRVGRADAAAADAWSTDEPQQPGSTPRHSEPVSAGV